MSPMTPNDDDAEQRQVALVHVEAGEQHRRLGTGQRRSRRWSCVSSEHAARPRSRMTCVAKVTSESVTDASASSKAAKRSGREPVCAQARVGFAPRWRFALFDTETPLAPTAGGDPRPDRRGASTRGAFILGPEVEAFEREFARVLGRRSRGRRRQRHRRDHDRAACARRAARRRGGRAVVHVLRDRGGGRHRRRDGRCSATSIATPATSSPERSARRLTPRLQGDRRRRSVRLSGAGAGAASAGPAGARGCGAGRRREPRWSPGRRPRRRRHVLVLPVQEPRLLRRWRGDRHRRRRGRRARADASVSRLARQADVRARSATTRASTSSRRRSCGCCCRISTGGATAGARPRDAYAQAGLGEHVTLPACPTARSRHGICTSSRHPAARSR